LAFFVIWDLSMNTPHDPELLFRQAMEAHAQGRSAEALENLERAAALRPNHAGIWNNRGNILRDLGRFEEALASFDRSLALKPDSANALYNRANMLLLNLGRAGEALPAYDQALALNPRFAEAWNNRGNALATLGRFEEALASNDQALALRPDFAAALNCRAQILFEAGRVEEGFATFRHSAALAYGDGQTPGGPPYKLRHDREQQEYLAAIGGRSATGAVLAGPAVTPGNTEAGAQWQARRPQIAVIDNLLTPAALAELRNFCLEAPVWRKFYANGYLGAFPEHGFACPLLGQIGRELQAGFPDIFQDHPLLYTWGFKYDSRLTGIALHADEAAVNVNFWLTPDEANLDPQSGGLVIWDVAAPRDWDFAKFNTDTKAMRTFLAGAGAKSVTVPYRANRAVIFDSDLFHETDAIRFQDGYLNRRINVTMLFGRR
jgi:Flp pilus assembly protein TadD